MEKSNSVLDTISNVTFKADFDRVRPPGEDYHSSQRDIIAVLREDMSYNMNTDISKMRYMRVQTIRVKPGHAREWEESRRMSRAAHEKGTVHEWTADEARLAGRKGGQVSRGGRGRLVVPGETEPASSNTDGNAQ